MAQKYFVTRTNDSVFVKGTLTGNHLRPDKWTAVKANGTAYRIRDIKCIQMENDFYINMNFRQLWKRVVKGRINVYARNDKDTIHEKKRFLNKTLFIQKEKNPVLLKYNYFNLTKMIENDSLLKFSERKIHLHYGGKAMMVAGIITTSITAVAFIFTVMLGPKNSVGATSLTKASLFFLSGIGNLIASTKIENNSSKISLDPIYYYNSL